MIWIAFLIQPFLTLLYALNNYRAIYAKDIMWAFAVFYSISIAVGAESSGFDIVRYMAEVETAHSSGIEITRWYEYHQSTRYVDIAQSFLVLLVAQFTSDGHYLVVLYGLIYGYFFSRNIWFVFDKLKGKPRTASIILIVCLFLVVPLWAINAFRFWVATHVFIFGLLPYLYSGQKKTLIWCILTPFVFHFAFIVPVLLIIGYVIIQKFINNKITPYFTLFVISIFVSEINIEQFNYYVETYAPQAFVESTKGYRNVERVYLMRSGSIENSGFVWYAALYHRAFYLCITTYLLVLFVKTKDLIKTDPSLIRILSFTYLFYAVGNLMSSIPSGGRYIAPAAMLAISVLAIYVQNSSHEKWMQRVVLITMPLLLLFIIVSLREGLYLASTMTVLGNPLVAIFTIGENMSLNDILKSLF